MKIDKYRAGYAALDVRKAFLPAVVSTSGRIHGDLLRLLYLLADNKTKRHYRDRHEVMRERDHVFIGNQREQLQKRASPCQPAATEPVDVLGPMRIGGL